MRIVLYVTAIIFTLASKAQSPQLVKNLFHSQQFQLAGKFHRSGQLGFFHRLLL